MLIIGPCAIAIPLFMASDCPRSLSEIQRMWGCQEAHALMISTVPSDEPPSTTMCSATGHSCAITIFRQDSIKRSAFRVGVMTLIKGSLLGAIPNDPDACRWRLFGYQHPYGFQGLLPASCSAPVFTATHACMPYTFVPT